VIASHGTSAAAALRTVKLLHTIVWAFFAASILAIAPLAGRGEHGAAGLLIAVVFVEVLVLSVNGWRCPLTAVAARFTDDRRDNFDIYLPEWLARHNKLLFGALYLFGIGYTAVHWAR
jgi:polyferredoxin